MIQVEHLSKNYGTTKVLKDVNLQVDKGEVISIIGPSGTGKSTFLRCVNLLEQPSGGKIIIDGTDLLSANADVPAIRQKMGMVFQNFNLFEHFSVIDNLMVGPMKLLGMSHDEAEQQAMELLRKVALANKAEAFPSELSGGQKQRVAIARCLSMKPEVMLFDEPTSALDPTMVGEVLNVIDGLAEQGMTMLIVTHEMRFARNVSTRVCVMNDGVIYEEGSPQQIFEDPQKEFTRRFIFHTSNFDYLIPDANYDFCELNTKLELFCMQHRVPSKLTDNLMHVVEEVLDLCFFVNRAERDRIVKSRGGINLTVEYGEQSESTKVTLAGPVQLDTYLQYSEEDDYNLQIVKGFTTDIKENVVNDKLVLELTLK